MTTQCKSIAEQLENICNVFCEKYCKYIEQIDSLSGKEQDKAVEKYCTDCPLNKIF